VGTAAKAVPSGPTPCGVPGPSASRDRNRRRGTQGGSRPCGVDLCLPRNPEQVALPPAGEDDLVQLGAVGYQLGGRARPLR
jgi:hypothetical protein